MSAVKRLAAALAKAGYALSSSKPSAMTVSLARGVLHHDPSLATDIELGQAWREAEAALPEGWRLWALALLGETYWRAEAIGPLGSDARAGEIGPSPAEALRNLAAKLREAAPADAR